MPFLKPLKLPTPSKRFTGVSYSDAHQLWQLCQEYGVQTHNVNWYGHAAEHARRLDNHKNGTLSYCNMTEVRLLDLVLQRRLLGQAEATGTAVGPYWRYSLIHVLEEADAKELIEEGTIFEFLSLPPELRNTVYEYVLVNGERSLVLPEAPALFHVSKQIRRESTDIYFRLNTFVLPLESNCRFEFEPYKKEHSVNVTIPKRTWQWIQMTGGYFLPRVRTFLVSLHRGLHFAVPQCHIFEIDFTENFGKFELHYFGIFLPAEGYARYTADAGIYQLNPQVYRQLKSIAGNPGTRRLHRSDLLLLLRAFGGWRGTNTTPSSNWAN